MRGRRADRLVVGLKPGNAGGGEGAGWPGSVNGQPGGPGRSEGDGWPGFGQWSTGVAGRSQMSEPKLQDKPFQIDKMVVWEAFQRVKANKGAAGGGEECIAKIRQDVK